MGMREDITVRMGLDGSKLMAGAETAMQKIRGMNEGIGKLGLGSVASIGMIGMAFKSLMDYAEQLPASVRGYAGDLRDAAKGWAEFKEAGRDAAVSVMGFVANGGKGAADMLVSAWRYAWGDYRAIANEAVSKTAEENIEKLKAIEEIGKKINEQIMQRRALENSLVPLGDQRVAAEKKVLDLQAQYNAMAGDIYDPKKKAKLLEVEQARTELAKIQVSEAQAEKQIDEQLAAFARQQKEAKLYSMSHQERLNYWANATAEAEEKAYNSSIGAAEKGKFLMEAAKARAAYSKEISDWDAKTALKGRDLLEYERLRSKSVLARTESDRAQLAIYDAQIQKAKILREIEDMSADGVITKGEQKRFNELKKQEESLDAQVELNKSIIAQAEAKAKAEAQVTQELQAQVKEQNTLAGFSGDMGTMKVLGGIRTYDNPLDQKRYEAEREKFAKQGIDEEIAKWERVLARNRVSGTSASSYEDNAIRDRIKGLEQRESNLHAYLWDPNYKDRLGQGIFAQQVSTIGDPLGLQGQKAGATLDSIDEGIRDINTRLRLADLPKS